MPRAADIVGQPWLAVSQAGRAVAWIHQPIILAGLAAAVVVALVIARPPSRPKTGTEPALEPSLDFTV